MNLDLETLTTKLMQQAVSGVEQVAQHLDTMGSITTVRLPNGGYVNASVLLRKLAELAGAAAEGLHSPGKAVVAAGKAIWEGFHYREWYPNLNEDQRHVLEAIYAITHRAAGQIEIMTLREGHSTAADIEKALDGVMAQGQVKPTLDQLEKELKLITCNEGHYQLSF